MNDWWTNLSDRERVLVSIAGVLMAIVVFWFFVIQPIMKSNEHSHERLMTASKRMQLLEGAVQTKMVRAMSFTPADERVTVRGSLKSNVTQSAAEKGLSISRIQGDDDSVVGVFIDDADPRLLFYWADDLERNQGAEIISMTIDQAGGTVVRARLELESKR